MLYNYLNLFFNQFFHYKYKYYYIFNGIKFFKDYLLFYQIMHISLEYFNIKKNRDQLNHIFVLTNPLVVFISKLIIEKYKIPEERIILISYRNTNSDLIRGKIQNIKLSFFDKLFRKFFLFSLYGYRLRRILEKESTDFIFYCDWDNRDVIELINSKKCLGQAYIEEGQSSFNNFNIYKFKKNRFSQWLRLRRWKRSSDIKEKLCLDVHSFNEFYNDLAFAYFTISNNSFPLVDKNKKVLLKDFSIVKKFYKPYLIGIKNIGIMCSPRRLKENNWNFAIRNLVNSLPDNSFIKLHPEFYTNNKLIEKFSKILDIYKGQKKINICNSSTIIEAEMLFEEKILFGPLTSLEKYAIEFGSKFNKISIY